MRTAIEKAKVIKQFLEIAQPLPVSYAYGKEVQVAEAFVSYQSLGSPIFNKGIGNNIISERASYLVTVQTKTARENMIYSEMIKLATEQTRIQYVSDSPDYNPNVEGKVTNSIILYLFNDIEVEKVFTGRAPVQQMLQQAADRYTRAAARYGVDLSTALTDALDVDIPDGEYSYQAIVNLKKEYLDRLIEEEALISNPANVRTQIARAQLVKAFLQTVQPLEVSYGYGRGIKRGRSFVTYQDAGNQTVRIGIGNTLISERGMYIITVQTKTAQENMFYSDLIKLGTEGSEIEFISESPRKDTTVKSGWINTIIVYVYNNLHANKVVYTAEEVRAMMQSIADLYIFVTSIYRQDASQSFLDKLTVPELEDRLYTYEEFLEYKVEYLDRLLYTTTRY